MKIVSIIIPLISLVIFSLEIVAQEEDFSSSPEIYFQLGADVRIESTVNPDLKEPVAAGAIGLLISHNQFGLLQELVFLSNSSSSGNLKIDYQTLEWNQWVQYLIKQEQTFKPYLAAGVGLSQDKVDTILAGVKRTDKSRLFVNAGAAAGLLTALTSRVEILGEIRAWKFEQKKDPMFSGLISFRFR